MITQERLKEVLDYNPESGVFTWIVRPRYNSPVRSGDVAGSTSGCYRYIQIDQKNYKAARLAFLYVTGKFPELEVDHINRDKYDDTWANLREADRSTQNRNRGEYNHVLTINGVSKCVAEWAEMSPVSGARIYKRIGRGWDSESAVFREPMNYPVRRLS